VKILYINTPIYDYLTATLIEGLIQLGHNVVCTESSNYGIAISEPDLPPAINSADLIIVGSNIGVRRSILERTSNPRIVFVDGSDSRALEVDSAVRYKAVFKRELYAQDPLAKDSLTFPLPFAAENRYFAPEQNKDILISFLANMQTNPLRSSIHLRLRNKGHPRIISGMTNERAYLSSAAQSLPMQTPHYHALLARSLISVNVPGAGYDCARYWEILAARAMLFTFASDILIPYGFTDGVDCVTFSSFDEFDSKLNFYMANPDRAIVIAKQGFKRLLDHHTTARRAEYFLEHALAAIQRPGYWTFQSFSENLPGS
jgi:glycosyl transferase family 1